MKVGYGGDGVSPGIRGGGRCVRIVCMSLHKNTHKSYSLTDVLLI